VTSLSSIAEQLRADVDRLSFSLPVTHVYNPLAYAWEPHRRYLERWGGGRKEVVLLGMNPGPWGMAQTGVPFGEVELVRDWLGVEAPVGGPGREHPRRPIEGFACARREVSGQRLWGWARERCGTPEAFFARFLVLNYCPLVFLEQSGRNRTPDKLPAAEREPLEALCDRALSAAIEVLSPDWVIGVGAFAEARARRALAGLDVTVGGVLHPSPASPVANRGWAERAEAQLQALGIDLPG